MAPPTDPPHPSTNHAELHREVEGETTITGLHPHGTFPAGLSGQLIAIGPSVDADSSGIDTPDADNGMVHSVLLHAGRFISYRSRWVVTTSVAQRLGVAPPPGPRNTGPDIVASNIVAFGGSILALGEGSLAHELTPELDTLRRVDLAGQSRALAAFPKRDPITGGLHLLTVAPTETQAHVVVSSGALTRTTRTLDDAPTRITDLAITRDRVVLAADGFIGVMPRAADSHTTWITTDLDSTLLIHAHDVGDSVVVYAVTPWLERWTLRASSATMHREVLDRTPRRFARTSDQPVDEVPRFLWTAGNGTADKHDLETMNHVRRIFRPGHPGDLVFVRDVARLDDADGGWLVGFVHNQAPDETDLVVLDAADLALIDSVRIHRHIPCGVHSTWVPSTD